ncbi:hypothetical protein J7E93_33235 [Streptomyces sp. ISL-36]|uniref:hypothetical protein n=1 Tax=Streptomyces sp. ISL-36 TaxID=2819182 RepID=UPI001BEC006E|nr:hypothetical protein [Streptomyces sp. ISL-36]MBT2444876.1 hypothetical protein [Streptomyces sp. ISL-36]
MAYRRKLRATTVVCAAVIAGTAPAGAWAVADSHAPDVRAAAAAPSPSPDPFEKLSADQIADRAVTATQSATSLRMTGRVMSDDQPLDIDLTLNDKSECTGRMKIKGGTAELRQSDKATYMKGDERFWRVSMTSQGVPEPQIDATIELLKGRWLKITPGQAGSSDLSGVCDLKALLDDLGDDEDERRGLTRGPDAKVDGTPVATLVKKKSADETATVSVSQKGKPYILKTVKKGGDEPGTVVLSDYDKPVKVVVPPADETVDLSKLDRGRTT